MIFLLTINMPPKSKAKVQSVLIPKKIPKKQREKLLDDMNMKHSKEHLTTNYARYR